MKKKKVSNFFKCLFNSRKKKIVFGIGVLFLSVLIAITLSANFALNRNEKVVEFESPGYSDNKPGSWHITKSADWIEYKKAQVKFEVDSVAKMGDKKRDIVLILDISGSMNGEKIDKVKEDAKELTEVVLSDSQNRVALISFHSYATILSDFTNEKDKIISMIDSLSAIGTTNYTDALRKTSEVLNSYEQDSNRDLVALFLSDGYPCVETPNQIGEYTILKENYPNLTMKAIQYEMGSEIIKELKEISDNQYLAYKENLQNVLFEASIDAEFYDKFIINDYIEEKYFELGTIEEVKVSTGTATLTEENGLQKVTWDLGSDYRTGSSATMTIDLNLKDDVEIDINSIFPTNRKEDVEYKIPDEPEEKQEEKLTPKLRGAYEVIYDVNTPTGCTISSISIPKETHFVSSIVNIRSSENDLEGKCSGYLFKGWEMTDESSKGTSKINDDTFIMPGKNVTLKATWSQVSISKSMTGEKYELKYLMPFNNEEGFLDSGKSKYVTNELGIDFDSDSSITNGRGLYVRAGTENDEYPIFYYRGAVTNNNVLFANKCWKILRTTETGGTKLIYNGLPDESNPNGICANTGKASQIGTSSFNYSHSSPAGVGYMNGISYAHSRKDITESTRTDTGSQASLAFISKGNASSSNQYYVSTSFTYNGSNYVLDSPIQLEKWESEYSTIGEKGYYTCMFTNTNSCTTLYYLIGGTSWYYYAVPLTGGKTLEQVNSVIIATSVKENDDGTYSLTGLMRTGKKSDWFTKYSSYKNKYICSDFTSTTCKNMYYISETSNDGFEYESLTELVFGNDVEYIDGKYILKDTYNKASTIPWVSSYNNSNLTTRHYTCFTSSNTCNGTVYYIYHVGTTIYYFTLTNGKKIETILNEMFPEDSESRNKNNSVIKTTVDNWFSSTDGMLSYEKFLEDAVWCNDRSISTFGGLNKDNTNINNYLYFDGYWKRNLTNSSSLTPTIKNDEACPNKNDRFTVNDIINGNGALDYPVGLITIDEATIAGYAWEKYRSDTYLYTGESYWTLSPSSFGEYTASGFVIRNGGYLSDEQYNCHTYGVRPVISLRSGITASDGDGSAANPYRVG